MWSISTKSEVPDRVKFLLCKSEVKFAIAPRGATSLQGNFTVFIQLHLPKANLVPLLVYFWTWFGLPSRQPLHSNHIGFITIATQFQNYEFRIPNYALRINIPDKLQFLYSKYKINITFTTYWCYLIVRHKILCLFKENQQKIYDLSCISMKNRHNVDKITGILTFLSKYKIILSECKKLKILIIKNRKKIWIFYELGIEILKNSLYNCYNHRNGVMGRSV